MFEHVAGLSLQQKRFSHQRIDFMIENGQNSFRSFSPKDISHIVNLIVLARVILFRCLPIISVANKLKFDFNSHSQS